MLSVRNCVCYTNFLKARCFRHLPDATIMPTGTVRLVNAVFYAHHGVMQEEHRIGGRYEVDVSMEVDLEGAARADDLEQTVDYERIYQIVKRIVTTNRFYLIERLAYLIAHDVLASCEMVQAIEVTVRKPNPPVGGTCDHAEAAYAMPRSALGSE